MKRLLVFLVILVGSAFLLAGCSLGAATPSGSGEIKVIMRDYTFSTDVIRVKAGETVTIVLSNEGDKLHEFMIGRDLVVEGNFTEGFAEDLLMAVLPEISGPGMVMGLPGGGMDMSGMDMGNDATGMEGMDMADDESMDMADDESMDMADDESMDMADDESMDMTDDESMDMADDESMDMNMEAAEEDGEHSEETGGEFGMFQLPAMEDHAGVMIMIDPIVVASDQETRITFTVPESMVGRWQIGCFQEQGQHYDDGMRGIFIVEPAS
jgi:plastocyanin